MATKPSLHKDGSLSSTLTITANSTTKQTAGFDLITQDSTLLEPQIIMNLSVVAGGDGLEFSLIGSANSDLTSSTVIYTNPDKAAIGFNMFPIPYDASFRFYGIQCIAAVGETGTVDELFLNVPLEA